MGIEAGRAREGIAHLNGLVQHDDGVPGEPKIVPPSALTAENETFELGAAHATWRTCWFCSANAIKGPRPRKAGSVATMHAESHPAWHSAQV